MTRQRVLSEALPELDAYLSELGIWHCVAFGTLLGAVREGAIIEWDHDIDLLIRPCDIVPLVLRTDGPFTFRSIRYPGSSLTLNPGGIPSFEPGVVEVRWRDVVLGELWAPRLFSDGVLRLYDLGCEAYLWPQSSFPHFAVSELSSVSVDGRAYPAPRDPRRWLEWTYGPGWQTPYRARSDGGGGRPGLGYSGDVVRPTLAERVRDCVAQGWDRRGYSSEAPWPRPIRAGGPPGHQTETSRAGLTSGSDWWHTLDELAVHY